QAACHSDHPANKWHPADEADGQAGTHNACALEDMKMRKLIFLFSIPNKGDNQSDDSQVSNNCDGPAFSNGRIIFIHKKYFLRSDYLSLSTRGGAGSFNRSTLG